MPRPWCSKTNRWHVDIFQFFYLKLRNILQIPLNGGGVSLNFWIWAGYFSNSISSSVTRLVSLGEPTRTMVPWRQGFRHPTRNKCMGWFAQILGIPVSLFIWFTEPTSTTNYSCFRCPLLIHYYSFLFSWTLLGGFWGYQRTMSHWSKTTLNYWMTVGRYPNLKEEVGSSIPGYLLSNW